MSVVLIPVEDFELIYVRMLFHIENHTPLGSAILAAVTDNEHGAACVADLLEAATLNGKELSTVAAITQTISRTLWYMTVANRTAYAIQYHTPPDFEAADFEAAAPRVTKAMEVDTAMIAQLMRQANYHSATNAGTRFLADKWFGLFEALQRTIEAHENSRPGRHFVTQW